MFSGILSPTCPIGLKVAPPSGGRFGPETDRSKPAADGRADGCTRRADGADGRPATPSAWWGRQIASALSLSLHWLASPAATLLYTSTLGTASLQKRIQILALETEAAPIAKLRGGNHALSRPVP